MRLAGVGLDVDGILRYIRVVLRVRSLVPLWFGKSNVWVSQSLRSG
jgi:hypothetical protein